MFAQLGVRAFDVQVVDKHTRGVTCTSLQTTGAYSSIDKGTSHMRHGILVGSGRYSGIGKVAALAVAVAFGMGCSMQTSTPSDQASVGSESQFVSVHLATAPAFVAHSGAVTVTLSDETAEVYVQASDSSLMVNGVQAIDNSTTPPTVAIAAGTKANVKSITVVDTAGVAGDVLILNYINGLFGQGTAMVAGTVVTFKSGNTNALVLKGTGGNDSFAFGAGGISLNNVTPTKDITAAHVSSYDVYLGAGDDKFTASGNSAFAGVFASAVAVYGGPGNDTLVEGAVSTPHETFSGGAGTDTVDYSARTVTVSAAVDPTGVITSGVGPATAGDPTAGATEGDVLLDVDVILGGSGNDQLMGALVGSTTLNGGLGNDTFCEGDDTYKNGGDTLIGGGGTDTVDYSNRLLSLTVVMDGKTLSGDPSGNGGAGEKDVIGTDVANIKTGGTAVTSRINVIGNAMNNVFTPGPGVNVISGLAGDDTVVEGLDANNTGMDTFHGGTGTDVVDYSLRTNPLSVTMDNMTASGDTANSEHDVIDVDVENCYGGTGDDVIVGNALDNDLEGNAGDDTLSGMGGNDTLLGAAASGSMELNHLHGNNAADTAEPGAFNLCINIGDVTAMSTPATPAAAGALAANCQLAQD
jgi:Ca2+-binding RTX toxin-like protein